MITCIQLSSITLPALCGCLPEERVTPVNLLVTVRLRMAVSVGDDPARDRLDATLDYRRVLETLHAVVSSRHFATLESLAETVAQRLRMMHAAVRSVEVEISKPGVLPDGVVPTITAIA
jgi:dihydroneopterin aldolase